MIQLLIALLLIGSPVDDRGRGGSGETAGAKDLGGECLYFDEVGDPDTYYCSPSANTATLTAGGTPVLLCDASGCLLTGTLDVGDSRITSVGEPTSFDDAATKYYVDNHSVVLSRYFLGDAASSDLAGYKQLTASLDGASNTVGVLGDSSPKAIEEWATESGVPNLTSIEAGVVHFHFWAEVDSAGATDCDYQVRAQLYSRTVGGAETQIGTDSDTAVLTASTTKYDIHTDVPTAVTINSSDRLVAKLLAVRVCSPPKVNDATVTITYGDSSTPSLVTLPVSLPVLSDYLPTTGGTLTGSLTLPNSGLHILDTNATHDLVVAAGSDLTADHTLTFTTGDADRTVTLTGDITLPDPRIGTLTNTKWCTTDGSVINCTSDSPSFGGDLAGNVLTDSGDSTVDINVPVVINATTANLLELKASTVSKFVIDQYGQIQGTGGNVYRNSSDADTYWSGGTDYHDFYAGAKFFRLIEKDTDRIEAGGTNTSPIAWISGAVDIICANSGDGNPGSLNPQVTYSHMHLTSNDSDGCDVTLSETDAAEGMEITIILESANAATIKAVSGVTVMQGGTDFVMGQGDAISFHYGPGFWVEISRSDNTPL